MFQNIGGGWLAKLSLLFVEVFLEEGRELYDYYKHSSPRSWRPSRSCTRTSRWRSWGLMWMESCWSLRSPVLSKLPSTKFWEALKLYFWPVKFVLIIFVKLSFTFSSTRIKSNNVSEFEAPHQSNVATLAFVRFWRLRVYEDSAPGDGKVYILLKSNYLVRQVHLACDHSWEQPGHWREYNCFYFGYI